MRIVYLNVAENCPPEVKEVGKIECNLSEIRRLIGCNSLDSTVRTFNGVPYRILCDDVGYFAAQPKLSAYCGTQPNCHLVGNLVVCGMEDEEGWLTDLTDEDIERIKHCTLWYGLYEHYFFCVG